MTNTERLIQSLTSGYPHGVARMTFWVGKYTGNGPSVVNALRRRGYQVTRQANGSYVVCDPTSDAYKLEAHRALHRTVHPDVAAARRAALANAQEQLQLAIGHLNKVLNGCRNANEQMEADRAARDWLNSIGAA